MIVFSDRLTTTEVGNVSYLCEGGGGFTDFIILTGMMVDEMVSKVDRSREVSSVGIEDVVNVVITFFGR
jgi:hypothetical protein